MASKLLPFVIRAARPAACAVVLAAPLVVQPSAAQSVPDGVPFNLPNKGVLELRGGNATKVVYVSTGFEPETVSPPTLAEQLLATDRRNDCRLSQPQTSQLLGFFAAPGTAARVGIVTGSLGVYSGSQGTPCSRFTAALNHELTVDLGQQLENAIPNVAFYRLELDIEAKSNLSLELQILRNGAVTDRYYLRTGSSIVAGQGSPLPGSPDRIFNCSAQSDSGPDAGARDNCRWEINELGHGFRLKPLVGEGSLEGGGDPGVAGPTKIYLTEAIIGALGCDATNNTTPPLFFGANAIGKASCQAARFDPSGLTGGEVQCAELVGYVLRSLDGAGENSGCELLKSPGEQLAASMVIAFPPEEREALGAENETEIFFSTGPNPADLSDPFIPPRCTGTVIQDKGVFSIEEVLLGTYKIPADAKVNAGKTLDDVTDAVPGNGVIDWACILDNAQYYLERVDPPAEPLCGDLNDECMQVQQTILFWGDIRFSRE